jgi:predicted DNA-binding transcriptional regulator YafY
MRASRLVALLLHLQSRGSATAPELAERLDVSVRTIYRDIGALQAAGAPLWTEPGPSGGVRLLDGWRTDLDGLTSEEAAALFLGGPPGIADDLGLGPVLAAAQVKMLAALSPEAAVRATEARSRFLLDAPGWFHRDEPTEALGVVASAVWGDHRLDLRYRVGERRLERRVDPLGLVLKAGVWYLLAQHRGSMRTYRVSRIEHARVRDEPATRPPSFDLARAWAEVSTDFDRSMLADTVRLRASPEAQRRLPLVVPSVATADALAAAGPPDGQGWRELTISVESERIARDQLIGLGGEIEVLGPATLRRAIAETGRAIVERHTGRASRRLVGRPAGPDARRSRTRTGRAVDAAASSPPAGQS